MRASAASKPIEDMAILIVDDSDVIRLVLERSLRERGFSTVLAVESGERALQEVERFNTDIVILDIMMPGMGGLACCSAIREIPAFKELPVLMGTSATEISLRMQAFESGATDFINTPILPDELHARVKVHLQNRRYIQELRRYRELMMQEMRNAHQLQESILPGKDEFAVMREQHGLEFAAHFEPSLEVGGDFWGMKPLGAQQSALWMVDFSGHGITAAMNAFRLQAYLKDESPLAASPGDYLTEVNGKLLQLLLGGHFATMFYGVLDTKASSLAYSCACAPNPLLIRGVTGNASLLRGQGNLLGISVHEYPTEHVPLHAGDTLILYSDALTETPDADGNTITEGALLQLVARYAHVPAYQLRDVIVGYFREHGEGRVNDDFTLTICKRVA